MEVGTQDITYWAPSGSEDRYGKKAVSTPSKLTGRWEDKVEVVVNKLGEDIKSKSRAFFIDQTIDVDGWLAEGDLTAQNDPVVAGASQVLAVTRTPDLSNLESLTTVYLR